MRTFFLFEFSLYLIRLLRKTILCLVDFFVLLTAHCRKFQTSFALHLLHLIDFVEMEKVKCD